MDKGTFKVVDRQGAVLDANILDGRFVLAIKNVVTSNPSYKGLFLVQGHAVREK